MTFLFMFRLELPLCHLALVNLHSKNCGSMHSAHWGLIQPQKLFPPPLHLCLYIILKCQSAFPLALWLSFCSTLSHTHAHAVACTPLYAPFICFTRAFQHQLHTYSSTGTHTHMMDTHTHMLTNRARERERQRDPKHQNSINPLRRSLKGFLKADFHHTEAFQVSTVCGGNSAEAFKLYALTFPLCYFLFLPPFSHSLSSSLFFSVSFLFSTFALHLFANLILCPHEAS